MLLVVDPGNCFAAESVQLAQASMQPSKSGTNRVSNGTFGASLLHQISYVGLLQTASR